VGGGDCPHSGKPVAAAPLLLLFFFLFITREGLQCFDAVGWAAGKASGL